MTENMKKLILIDELQDLGKNYEHAISQGVYLVYNKTICVENIKKALEKEQIPYEFVMKEDLGLETQRTKKKENQVIVDCCKKAEYKALAAYHAALNGAEVIESSFGDLVQVMKNHSYEYYTIVVEPSEITNEVLMEVLILQMEWIEAGKAFYWGILTGRNAEILNALIVKNDIFKTSFSDEYVLINRTDYNTKDLKQEGNTTTMFYHNASTEVLRKIQEKHPINALSVIGHGRDDVIWMTDGCICGRSKLQGLANEEEKDKLSLPLCAHENRCFMREGNIFYAHEVEARHLFVNACKSSKLGGCVFDESFNTAFSFFEGHAITHIGCNATIMGQETSNYYYEAQMRLGINLGRITANLSKMYIDQGMPLSEAYYLLGDPTFCNVSSGQSEKFEIDKLQLDGEEKRFEFEVEKDLEILEIDLSISNLEKAFFNLEWQLMGYFTEQRAWGVFHKSGEGKTMLRVFSDYTIKAGEKFTLMLQKRSDYQPERIFNYSQVLDMGFVDNKLKLPILETKEVASKLFGRYEHDMNILDHVYKDTYKKLDKLFKRVPVLNKLLVDYFVEKTQKTGFCWEEYVSINGMKFKEWNMEQTHGRCSNCNRLLFRKEYYHMYNQQIKRYQYDCPVCGFVREIPVEDENLGISIIGDSHMKLGSTLSQTVVFENKNEKEYVGCVGIAIVDGKDFMVQYQENVVPFSFGKQEECQVNLSLSIDSMARPHQYWLKFYIVMNGKMAVLKRDIWVSP